MRLSACLVLLAAVVSTGCARVLLMLPPPIAGSGVSKEETRSLDPFHALEASSATSSNRLGHFGGEAKRQDSW